MLSRRTLLAGAAGAGTLSAFGALGVRPAVAADTPKLNYSKGICIPGYAGRGLLFAEESVMRAQIDLMVSAGIGCLRTDILGQQIAPDTTGTYDWSAYDRLLNYTSSQNVKVLLDLQGECTVDGPSPNQARTAGARKRLAALAAACVKRYGTKLSGLQVGNEVNTTRFWLAKPSVDEYGPLLAAVYTAVKQVSSSFPVLCSGTGGKGTSSDDMSTMDWYGKFYGGGWQKYCDAIAIHPYSNFTTTVGKNEQANLKPLRTLMNNNGDKDKPICGTETGCPTGGSYGVSQADQATILLKSWNYFRANAGVAGPLFFYTLYDFAPPGGPDAENYFGLVSYDGTRKPAFDTVQGLS